VKAKTRATILNPARLDYVHANDTCIQCHSQGRPHVNPIEGRYYDWPVGFHVGLELKDFWSLEEHTLGETTFTHFPDGTAHKNRMQGNDFVQSLMYTRGVTCFSCHDPHGSANAKMLVKTGQALCLDCHDAFPKTAKVKHQPVENGECLSCHNPHGSGFKKLLIKADGKLCYECHDDLQQSIAKAPFKHDPAANGECASCHAPHQSVEAKLLVKDRRQLCFDCHEEKDSFAWELAKPRRYRQPLVAFGVPQPGFWHPTF